MRSLSIVLPAHDEASSVARAVAESLAAIERHADGGEVLVVDDGSTDGTAARAASVDPRVRVLRHPVNRGYGAALRTGFAAATADHVFFTDADLQFDVAELGRLARWTPSFDLVVGYRSPRRDGWVRRASGWGWNRVLGSILALGVRDVDCAFKLLHRRVLDQVSLSSDGAFVNGELLARARHAGFPIKEVPVSHRPRRHGRPSGGDLHVITRAWLDLGLLYGELRPGLRAPSPARPAVRDHSSGVPRPAPNEAAAGAPTPTPARPPG